MEKVFFTTTSEQETTSLAGKILEEALGRAGLNKPLIFYLEGELGSGKTHFVKGVAHALGIEENITSPTFVLMKKYALPRSDKAASRGKSLFFHIDCYRIYDSEDAKQIGLDKILESHRAVIAVEWAERISKIMPRPYWKIEFEHIDENTRKISVKNER